MIRVFLIGEAKKVYLDLKNKKDKESRILINSINRVIDLLKIDPFKGQPLNKKLIPKKFQKKEIKKLYRVELSNFWRLLYTIESGKEIEINIFILEILNHKKYNKLLGYK